MKIKTFHVVDEFASLFRMSDPAYCANNLEPLPEQTPPLFSVEDIKKLPKEFIEVCLLRIYETT